MEQYRHEKNTNVPLNLLAYAALNKDLLQAKLVSPRQLGTHWTMYGRHEPYRLYHHDAGAGGAAAAAAVWPKVHAALRTNSAPLADRAKLAFVVTTCVRTPVHLGYLAECLLHIRRIYPHVHIYVINDNSQLDITETVATMRVQVVPSLVRGGGEINPYLFMLDPRCVHDKLVYIHDTVFLKGNIDTFLDRTNDIDFLWYCDSAQYADTFVPENAAILNQLFFYCSNTKVSIGTFIQLIKANQVPFTVKFGAMAVFTRQFMDKVDVATNFKSVAHLFCKRIHRCFFERILGYLVLFIHGHDTSPRDTLCGHILHHPRANHNTAVYFPFYRQPLVKVWQGR
jgi:hypothetical protein